MHKAHDKMSMYEYGNTNLIYTTITFWESLFSSFRPAKLDTIWWYGNSATPCLNSFFWSRWLLWSIEFCWCCIFLTCFSSLWFCVWTMNQMAAVSAQWSRWSWDLVGPRSSLFYHCSITVVVHNPHKVSRYQWLQALCLVLYIKIVFLLLPFPLLARKDSQANLA